MIDDLANQDGGMLSGAVVHGQPHGTGAAEPKEDLAAPRAGGGKLGDKPANPSQARSNDGKGPQAGVENGWTDPSAIALD